MQRSEACRRAVGNEGLACACEPWADAAHAGSCAKAIITAALSRECHGAAALSRECHGAGSGAGRLVKFGFAAGGASRCSEPYE